MTTGATLDNTPSGASLKGASDDDPLLEADQGRHRITLGALARYFRYVAQLVDDGDQILLTPVVVAPATEASRAEATKDAVNIVDGTGIAGLQHGTLAQVDKRRRISLGPDMLRYRRYLGTLQDDGLRILLTPVTLLPAHLEHLFTETRGRRLPKAERVATDRAAQRRAAASSAASSAAGETTPAV